MKKSLKHKVYFFNHNNGRLSVDALDTYNWLLVNGSKLAEEFKLKMKKATKNLKELEGERDTLQMHVTDNGEISTTAWKSGYSTMPQDDKLPIVTSVKPLKKKSWWKIF
jgi:hypothetical protein